MTIGREAVGKPRSGPVVARRSRLTVTESCVEALLGAIEDGTYGVGSKLPAEAELATQLQASRATIREALQALQARGLISREHGRGTFVSDRSINKDLNQNFGITKMIEMAGYTPTSRDLEVALVQVGREPAKYLNIPPESDVVWFSRILLADGTPVVLSENYIPADLIPRADWPALKSGQESLYAFLHQKRAVNVSRATAELLPVVANKALARTLQVHSGAPLLCLKQTDYDERERAVVYSVEYHVADWIQFTVERKGPW